MLKALRISEYMVRRAFIGLYVRTKYQKNRTKYMNLSEKKNI